MCRFVVSLQKSLGRRLRQLREEKGWTQEILAAKTSLAPRHINYLEHGKRWPRPGTLESLARELEVEARDLFDFRHLG
jgi:transcriptional regulator with XRE-family HTH domain